MLIDSHSHIDTEAFDADRATVIERARQVGVKRQIVPAIAREGWGNLADVCNAHAGLFPAYGLHPMFLDQHHPRHLEDLIEIIDREKPLAIGECGLDFHVAGLDRDNQYTYFNAQLELARDRDLPVIVHARRAFDEVASCLRKFDGLRGVVHSFSGSQQQAEAFWKLGFLLGIGGPVTYPRASRLRGIVADMPIDTLLLETDSPDQPVHGHQGRRNEPSMLVEVLSTVAELRGESCEQIAQATTLNAQRLFNLPDAPSSH
ncbi:MAG TPA: TatD family hydrolase [Dokdonella sp.]|uniref:TatD family hydrolase n=1 Tax=Dokdonella sp. TaxID=2291710 RepID=UPI002D810020|nr:TatD family hydrolase [Dokdonella sp.]HET9034120.1 TatD family hydrolase [Dokdonella sp.]